MRIFQPFSPAFSKILHPAIISKTQMIKPMTIMLPRKPPAKAASVAVKSLIDVVSVVFIYSFLLLLIPLYHINGKHKRFSLLIYPFLDLLSRGKNIVEIDSQRDVTSFSPVLGGDYSRGMLYGESTRGVWWGSTAYSDTGRYHLGYNSSFYTGYYGRHTGYYVRCVQAS